MNDYECLTCSYQFKEDQLVTVPGTFECYCPQCGSEDMKDTDEARASWPKPITVVPVVPNIPKLCDDCEKVTDWKHAVQEDPWGIPTGEIFCENCAEKRWDRYQQYQTETYA